MTCVNHSIVRFVNMKSIILILAGFILLPGYSHADPYPAAPSDLQATFVSFNNVQLTWTDNSNDEEHFIIQRKTGGNWKQLAELDPDTTAYTDTDDLSGLLEYTYQVGAWKTGEPQEKFRYVVCTDITGDPDDQQSMVRLMVYSNDIDIEAICLAPFTSMAGSLAATNTVIDAYEQSRPNLLLHDEDYPTADYLRSIIKQHRVYPDGHGDWGRYSGVWQDHVGPGMHTEASNYIITLLEKPDTRPLWFGMWGGPVPLAQACYDIWNSGRSQQEKIALLAKIRVYDVNAQDASYFYVEDHLSEYVHWVLSDTSWIGVYKRDFPCAPNDNCELAWANENIVNNHGPLGQAYPASSSGPTGVKEGDTLSYLWLVPNGLNAKAEEQWGGWGGQYKHSLGGSSRIGFGHAGSGPERWTDDENDLVCGGELWLRRIMPVARWRDHYNRDFAARMDWCVMNYEQANHNPAAAFNGDASLSEVILNVSPGQAVQLSAAGSYDPDSDTLAYHWWHYREAEQTTTGYTGNISIADSTSSNAGFTVPTDAAGKRIHIMLEVTDSGTWNLKGWKRIICQVN